jgi:hypothetical protein
VGVLRIAERFRILDLPASAAKEDVVDWIKAGGAREELDALGIFRPMNELVDRKLDCIPPVHNFPADDTFFDVILGRP